MRNLNTYQLSILHTILLRVNKEDKDKHRTKLQHKPLYLIEFNIMYGTNGNPDIIDDWKVYDTTDEEYDEKFQDAKEIRTFDNHRQLLTTERNKSFSCHILVQC